MRALSQLSALLTSGGLVLATVLQQGWMLPLALLPMAWHLRRSASFLVCLLSVWLYQGYIHRFCFSYSWVGWIVLVSLKTLPFCLLVLARGRRFDAATLAGSWTLAEWLNSIGPYGHTGGSLSHILADSPFWIQTARWFGCFYTTFFLVWVGATMIKPRRHSGIGGLALGLLIPLAWFTRASPGQTQPLEVGLVQTQMESREKFKEPRPVQAAEGLFELTARAGAEAELVVWPETAFPWPDLRWDPEWSRRLGQLTRDEGFDLIAGSLAKMENGWQNTLHLVSEDGRFSDSYGKRRLVPLVEFLPYEGWRQYSLFEDVSEIVPGSGSGVFLCRGKPVGVMICWESMSCEFTRSLVDKGCEILIVATNDQWFKGSDVALYHLQMSAFRAVESGRPVLHVGNGGYTAHIDSKGEVVAVLPEEERGILLAQVKPKNSVSLYGRFGDGPFLVLMVILLGGYLSRIGQGPPPGPGKEGCDD